MYNFNEEMDDLLSGGRGAHEDEEYPERHSRKRY